MFFQIISFVYIHFENFFPYPHRHEREGHSKHMDKWFQSRMHTDSGNTRMHDCRDFSYMKSKKRHLHQHICIRILIVKVIIFGIKQKCFPVQTLKSCGWICKIFTCPSAKQEAKPHEGNFFAAETGNSVLPSINRDPRTMSGTVPSLSGVVSAL